MLEKFLKDPEIRTALEYGDKYRRYQLDGENAHREDVEIYLASESNPDKDIIILMLMGHAIDHMEVEDVERLFGRVITAFSGDDPNVNIETPLSRAFYAAVLKISTHMLRDLNAQVEENKLQIMDVSSRMDSVSTDLQEMRQTLEFNRAERPKNSKLH